MMEICTSGGIDNDDMEATIMTGDVWCYTNGFFIDDDLGIVTGVVPSGENLDI